MHKYFTNRGSSYTTSKQKHKAPKLTSNAQ
jgi:hypothetical protein